MRFLRVSSIEEYNTVYNYDLIGIVETLLDNTDEDTILAIDGYSFHRVISLKWKTWWDWAPCQRISSS